MCDKFKVIVLILLTSNAVTECKPASQDGDGLRIVGGDETEIDEHPYTVSVQYFGNHLCGGSILSSTWILTAGHCFGSSGMVLIDFLSVRAGSSYHRKGGTQLAAKNLIRHQNYTSSFQNDIALVEVATPLEYSDLIQPIDLPKQGEELPPWTRAIVVGWGHTTVGGNFAEKLREVRVYTIPREMCADIYGDEFTLSMMCAHDLAGGKDSCNGDSGGPLVAGGRQAGVVSAGARGTCGDAALPGVYSQLSHFTEWIHMNTGI